MGERHSGRHFGVGFNSSVKMRFVGAQVTSDAGLLAGRELDERLGLTELAAEKLWNPRSGANIPHTLPGPLRQSVYACIAGYEDTNDADHLQSGPTIRAVVGRLDEPGAAASSSEMGRFETEWLPDIMNFEAVRTLPGAWVHRTQQYCPVGRTVLDMDRSRSPTHANHEGAAYNDHLEMEGYHPLFCFNQFGTWKGRCCGRETSTAPRSGRSCWSRS